MNMKGILWLVILAMIAYVVWRGGDTAYERARETGSIKNMLWALGLYALMVVTLVVAIVLGYKL